jgi:hypothetical protein
MGGSDHTTVVEIVKLKNLTSARDCARARIDHVGSRHVVRGTRYARLLHAEIQRHQRSVCVDEGHGGESARSVADRGDYLLGNEAACSIDMIGARTVRQVARAEHEEADVASKRR